MKKKEEKRQKVIKIFKIVGSALGLTLCGAGFIALLVIGIRGCTGQVSNKDTPVQAQSIESLNANNLNENVSSALVSNNDNLYNFVSANSKYPSYFSQENFLAEYQVGGYVCNNYLSGSNGFTPSVYFERFNSFYIEVYTSSTFTDVSIQFASYAVVYRKIGSNNWIYQNDIGSIGYDDMYALDGYLYLNSTLEDLSNDDNLTTNQIKGLNVLERILTADFRTCYDYGITFNNVINPFAPYGGNYDYFISNNYNGGKTIFQGLFTDTTGELYTGIKMYYINAQGTRYGTPTDYHTYTADGSHYIDMTYIKLDKTEIMVNAQDFATATSGNEVNNIVMLKTNRWISNVFQTIRVLDMYENVAGYPDSTLNRMQVLSSLNNNVTDNASYYNGSTNLMGNVFDLLRSAFSAWLPILNVQVLPGIALGVFVFLPLIVSIVIFVVWLFKR